MEAFLKQITLKIMNTEYLIPLFIRWLKEENWFKKLHLIHKKGHYQNYPQHLLVDLKVLFDARGKFISPIIGALVQYTVNFSRASKNCDFISYRDLYRLDEKWRTFVKKIKL